MRFGQQVHAIGMPKYVPEQHGRYELATQPANLVVHVVAVLVWFATGIAVAQTPPAVAPQPKLTLAQAIALAERNYPRIRAISGPVLAADDGRSAWSSAGGALVSWQPFDFGLRRAQVNSAQQGAAAATAGLNLTRLDVEVAAANAYLDLVTAQQLLGIARANLDRLQVFAISQQGLRRRKAVASAALHLLLQKKRKDEGPRHEWRPRTSL
jgi:hypothetical protein